MMLSGGNQYLSSTYTLPLGRIVGFEAEILVGLSRSIHHWTLSAADIGCATRNKKFESNLV